MSLVGVLVTAAFLSTLMIFLLQVVNTAQRAERNLASKDELSSLVREVNLFLGNPTACRDYLLGKTFNPTPATLDLQKIPNLIITKPALASFVVAEVGKTLDKGATITDLSLGDLSQNGTNQFVGKFAIAARLNNGTVVTRKIPVAVTTQVNSPTVSEIIGCSATGGGGANVGTPSVFSANATGSCVSGCTQNQALGIWNFCGLTNIDIIFYDNAVTSFHDNSRCSVNRDSSGAWTLTAHYISNGNAQVVGRTLCSATCF